MGLKHLFLAVVVAMLVTPLAAQEGLEIFRSDWVEQTPGSRDGVAGVEVREVEESPAQDRRSITLAIPKTMIDDTAAIEEVVVVGRKPEEPEPLLEARVEWLKDLDEENYGLLIHLGKESNWPLRLYMSAEHGYLHLDSTQLMDPSMR